MDMTIAVELPSLGESVFEGTVARWLVAEGDMVEVDQPIVEVTTDKVDAEIPAPSAGMIEQLLVGRGQQPPQLRGLDDEVTDHPFFIPAVMPPRLCTLATGTLMILSAVRNSSSTGHVPRLPTMGSCR